jgi:hypothetical protein
MYLMSSIYHEAPHNAIFSSLQLLCPSLIMWQSKVANIATSFSMAGSPRSSVVPFGISHYNTCWIMKCLSQVSTAPCHWQKSFPLFPAISHRSGTFISPFIWPLYAVRSSGHFSTLQILNPWFWAVVGV